MTPLDRPERPESADSREPSQARSPAVLKRLPAGPSAWRETGSRHRDQRMAALADATDHLNESREFDSVVDGALARIGAAAALHRITVILYHEAQSGSPDTYELAHEWRAPQPTSPASPSLAPFRDASIESYLAPLRHGPPVWQTFDEIPAPFREAFARVGMQSMCVVPICVGSTPFGLIAFDDCEHRRPPAAGEMEMFASVARALGAAIHRDRMQRGHMTRLEARTAQLEKAQSALQAISDAVTTLERLEDLIPQTLRIVGEAFGAASAQFYECRDDDNMYLRWWLDAGGVYPVEAIIARKDPRYALVPRLAAGFRVGDDYFGMPDYERTRASVLDHARGTSIPEFDAFAVGIDWFHEINVPLRAGSRFIGAVCVYRGAVAGPYRNEEITLLETLAKPLALALQSVRVAANAEALSVETAVAQEQEAAMRERAAELAKANASLRATLAQLAETPDPRAFLGAVLAEITRQLGADASQLALYDEARDRLSTVAHVDDGLAAISVEFPNEIASAELGAFAILSTMHAPRSFDLEHESHLFWPGTVEFHRKRGMKTVYCVSLWFGERFAGFLGCAFRQPYELPQSKVELVQALAQQATLAAELIRLGEREREAAIGHEQEVAAHERAAELEKASLALQATIDAVARLETLDAFIPEALRIVTAAFGALSSAYFERGAADRIYLRHWLHEGRVYLPHELPGIDASQFAVMSRLAQGFEVPLSHLHGESPWDRRRATRIDHRELGGDIELQRFALSLGWAFEINVPLIADDRADGALVIYRSVERPFTEADVSLAESLGKQIAFAMQASRIAEREREAMVARERAAELAKANEALRRSVDRMSAGLELDALVGTFLSESVQVMRAAGGAVFVRVPGTRTTFALVAVDDDGTLLSREAIARDPHLGRLIDWSTEDPGGLFSALARGETPSLLVKDLAALMPTIKDYHVPRGHQMIWHAPLRLRGEVVGLAALAFCDTKVPDLPAQETFSALAQQFTLAAELSRLADVAREAAVTREQEKAAHERAIELAKANEALSRSTAQLVSHDSLSDFLDVVLQEAISAAGAVSGAVFLLDESGTALNLRAMVVRNRVLDVATDPLCDAHRGPTPTADNHPWAEMQQRQVFWLDYSRRDPLDWPQSYDWHTALDHRFGVCVPMIYDGLPIGFLGLAFDKSVDVQPSDARLEIARVLAQQAMLAVRLTRLAEEAQNIAIMREREAAAEDRARELATANQALRESAEQLIALDDLDRYLHELLRAAVRISGAAGGGIGVLDDSKQSLRLIAVIDDSGTDAALVDIMPPHAVIPLQGEAAIAWQEIVADRGYWWAPPEHPGFTKANRDYHRARGHRQVAHVAMRLHGQAIGLFGLAFRESSKPSGTRIEILDVLAQQAALAITLTRLAEEARSAAVARHQETATRQHAAELTRMNVALRRSVGQLMTYGDLDDFLENSLREAIIAVGAVSGAIFVHNEATDTLAARAFLLRGERFRPHANASSEPYGAPVPAQEVYAWTKVRASRDAAWLDYDDPDLPLLRESRSFHRQHGHRYTLALPVLHGEQCLGLFALSFDRAVDVQPAKTPLELCRVLAQQTALAVRLSALADSAREQAQRAAMLGERERIARDLHDTLGQGFAAIIAQVGAAQVALDAGRQDETATLLQRAETSARESMSEARAAVHALRPSTGQLHPSLEELIRRHCDRATGGTALQTAVRASGTPWLLDDAASEGLLRITQEAHANVCRHARATHFEVDLQWGVDGLRLSLRDDGRGFDPRVTTDGWGLLGMRDRVKSLGGRFVVHAATDRGTELLVYLPESSRENPKP